MLSYMTNYTYMDAIMLLTKFQLVSRQATGLRAMLLCFDKPAMY